MTDLKPCPFCGGKPIFYEYMGGHIIICRSCGINLTCSRGENFVKKWNTRNYPADVQQAFERMKPKKVINRWYQHRIEYGDCPACLCHVEIRMCDDHQHCYRCGQRLDWDE